MNKEIIVKFMDEVWNKKNLSLVDEIFSENAKIHSPLGNFITSEQMKETVQKWLTAIPDIQVDLLHMFEDNGLVVSHWKAQGTHQEELNGRESQNQPVDYQGVTIYRLEDGKVVEYWAYLDSWTLDSQIKGAQV